MSDSTITSVQSRLKATIQKHCSDLGLDIRGMPTRSPAMLNRCFDYYVNRLIKVNASHKAYSFFDNPGIAKNELDKLASLLTPAIQYMESLEPYGLTTFAITQIKYPTSDDFDFLDFAAPIKAALQAIRQAKRYLDVEFPAQRGQPIKNGAFQIARVIFEGIERLTGKYPGSQTDRDFVTPFNKLGKEVFQILEVDGTWDAMSDRVLETDAAKATTIPTPPS